MSTMTKAQILALQASELDFDTVLSGFSIEDYCDLLGLAGWLDGEGTQSLPSGNHGVEIEAIARNAQLFMSYKQKILLLSRAQVSDSIGQFAFTGADIVNSILPFSALSGMVKYPTSAGQCIVFKAGDPIAISDTVTRDGDAVLLKGTGIQFTSAWASDTAGLLWTLAGAASELARQYTFRASSFSGSGFRTVHLGNIGVDIRGNAISTIPDDSSQVMVFLHGVGVLTEGALESWVASGFGGTDPTITFNFDLLPDQNVTFVILR